MVTTKEEALEYFGSLSHLQIQRLYAKYKMDLVLFGYSAEDFINLKPDPT